MLRHLAVSLLLVAAGCSPQPGAERPAPSGPQGPTPSDQVQQAEPGTPLSGVERVAGPERIQTAVAVSERFWRRAPAVVLTTGADFPDALAAGALAGELGGPLLLTRPASLPEPVAAELDRLDAQEVVVVGGEAAVDAKVADDLRGRGLHVRRIAGSDRYATAARIVAELTGPQEVVVASGQAFADALAAAPRPVLLTAPDRLPETTADALRRHEVRRVLIAGGEAAVSATVARQIRALGPTVRRAAGPDRYATALALLTEGGYDPSSIVIAGGDTFADALPAGALAGLLGGAVALAPPTRLPDGLDTVLRAADPAGVALLGGAAALSAHVESEVRAALDGRPRPTATVTSATGFRGVAMPLPADVRERMHGVSWREGCPVGLADLAYLELRHHGSDGHVHAGELVVAAAVARDVLGVFAAVFDAGFPIERMRLVDDYDADDHASMDANNTSALNCRPVEGGTRWSEHAYGTAIDINPVQNPYRRDGTVLPEAGRAYLDRADVRPGMIVRPGPVVDTFTAAGWGWGGDWSGLDDWMHFSASGR